jgi:hypothetical protein
VDVACNAIPSIGSRTFDKKRAVCGFLAVALASCCGLPPTVAGGGQGSGGTLLVALRAIPPSPLGNFHILSFSATVVGVSLTPSTGGSVGVPLNAPLFQVEFARLQSDTSLLALSTSIPAGTYSNMVVSLSNPSVSYCTQTLGITGCAAGSVTALGGAWMLRIHPSREPRTLRF